MITRLKISGFKSLLDVDLRLGPLTCIVGENAVGKSNLFDAIRFLHLLATRSIPDAVAHIRESRGKAVKPGDLFTTFGASRAADEVKLSAEMVVKPQVTDEFGATGLASITSLRYDVAFALDPAEDRLVLREEWLRPITLGDARKRMGPWAKAPFLADVLKGARRGGDLISTDADGAILLHQDGHGGRKVPAAKSSRTILSSVNADFPTALAALREMESWRTLQLEPSAMRAPSLYSDPKHIDERGAYLASTLHRLARIRGPQVLSEIASRVARLVPDVRELAIEDDPRLETFTAQVQGSDGALRAARALSDGTLRFLVLATLAADPEATGTLCVEEPENGIHPERVSDMVELLYDLAVDASGRVNDENPLRQVLVNTHSPLVFRRVNVEDVVFLEFVDAIEGGARARGAAIRVPEKSWRATSEEPRHLVVQPARTYAWEQMSFRYHAADGT
ncbi:MAG TPA: AAA family ATPase [Polyangia bacterium]|nr:AAA family ATPase [Polyangia bacterium]